MNTNKKPKKTANKRIAHLGREVAFWAHQADFWRQKYLKEHPEKDNWDYAWNPVDTPDARCEEGNTGDPLTPNRLRLIRGTLVLLVNRIRAGYDFRSDPDNVDKAVAEALWETIGA